MSDLQPRRRPGPGSDGYHDPNKKPPQGFDSWQQVGEHNMEVIERAGRQQDALEANGYRYNSSNGTWSAPGRPDVRSLGGQLPQGAFGMMPGQRWGDQQGQLEGRGDDIDKDLDEEGEQDPAMRGFSKYTIWGRLLTWFGKHTRR